MAESDVLHADPVLFVLRSIMSLHAKVNDKLDATNSKCLHDMISYDSVQVRCPRNEMKGNSKMLNQTTISSRSASQVRDVFEDMFQAGMQPTVVTWNTLLASFAPTGDWVHALDVLNKVTPNHISLQSPPHLNGKCQIADVRNIMYLLSLKLI